MYPTMLSHDITTSIQYALHERLNVLPEEQLVQHSDALLAMLPFGGGTSRTTTAAFLRHYDTALHHEVCHGTQPRAIPETVADQLYGLTRAILVTGTAEGMSIEAAVGVALVLYKRGIAPYCAQPLVGRRIQY